MAFHQNTISEVFTDAEGVGIDSIFHTAANQTIPAPRVPAPEPPPEPTVEERLQKIEAERMATAPSTPDFDDPAYWNQGIPQQQQYQQPAPQVVVPQGEELKRRLPQNYEELQQLQQQTTINTLNTLQQRQMAINSMKQTMRAKMAQSPLAQYTDVACMHYDSLIASGVPELDAYKRSVQHVQNLKGQGLTVSKPRIPNPNNGAAYAGGGDGPYRPDEAGMKNRIGFYSAEDRIKDAKEYIDDRNMDSEHYKTRGAFGRSMQEKHRHLFHVE